MHIIRWAGEWWVHRRSKVSEGRQSRTINCRWDETLLIAFLLSFFMIVRNCFFNVKVHEMLKLDGIFFLSFFIQPTGFGNQNLRKKITKTSCLTPMSMVQKAEVDNASWFRKRGVLQLKLFLRHIFVIHKILTFTFSRIQPNFRKIPLETITVNIRHHFNEFDATSLIFRLHFFCKATINPAFFVAFSLMMKDKKEYSIFRCCRIFPLIFAD